MSVWVHIIRWLGVLVKMIIWLGNPNTCDCECNMTFKIDKYLDIKKCLDKKPLFRKNVLGYGNGVLNTAETSLVDKKVMCEIINCLIHPISLIIICLLLLVVIFVSCFFHYIKYWSKQNHLLPFNSATLN